MGNVLGGGSDSEYEGVPTSENSVEYNRADHMHIGCTDFAAANCVDVTPGQLRRDLATRYYWSGKFCKDYMFFVSNWHPLLGICLCHPMHPWSKPDRVATFIFSCALTMLPSSILIYTGTIIGETELANGVDPVAARIGPKLIIFVFITLPIMVWEIILYWVAVLEMYFQSRHLGTFRNININLDCVAWSLRCLKRCCLFEALCASAIVSALSLIVMLVSGAPISDMLRPFWTSRLQSWAFWFVLWFVLPWPLGFFQVWHDERRNALDALDQVA